MGLKITAGGVAPLPDQLAAIKEFPQPGTVKELQGFLGAVNFYRHFIPAAAKILLPLTSELKGGRKGPEILTWSSAMTAAFRDIKAALLKSVCLAFPKEQQMHQPHKWVLSYSRKTARATAGGR